MDIQKFLDQLKKLPDMLEPFLIALFLAAGAIWVIFVLIYRTILANKNAVIEGKNQEITNAKTTADAAKAQMAVHEQEVKLIERERDGLLKELEKAKGAEAATEARVATWSDSVKRLASELAQGETLTIDLGANAKTKDQQELRANVDFLTSTGAFQVKRLGNSDVIIMRTDLDERILQRYRRALAGPLKGKFELK